MSSTTVYSVSDMVGYSPRTIAPRWLDDTAVHLMANCKRIMPQSLLPAL
ncbi:MAG: hypothetical protein ACFB12_05080 [Leptolyngbyaceae cyanobacterium]